MSQFLVKWGAMEHQPYQPTEPDPAPDYGYPTWEPPPDPAAPRRGAGDPPGDAWRDPASPLEGRPLPSPRGRSDRAGFYPPPQPPFDAGALFDWDLIEGLADDPEPSAAPRSRTSWRMVTVAALLSALLTAAAGAALLWGTGAFDRPPPPESPAPNYVMADSGTAPDADGSASGELLDLPLDGDDEAETDGPPDRSPLPASPPVVTTAARVNTVAEVAEQVIPSIVAVYNYADADDSDPASSGSGVIFNTDGYLLTNDHVIDGAGALRVILHNGRSLPAEVIGSDPLMDTAVLQVDWPDLRPVEFADIDTARIGDPTVAIGNPLGLDGGPSVTSGVISAFDRTLLVDPFSGAQLYGLLQTDTPITRGSSGGALLNRDGQLLGITAAIGISDVGAEGIGFAVPINLVTGIIDDLLADGEVRHAYLGIEGSPAFDENDDGVKTPIGVEVNRLLDGSGFGAAGGRAGDVITALDDQSVRSMTLLVARLRGYRADGEVKVSVLRDGADMELSVTLGQYPQRDDS